MPNYFELWIYKEQLFFDISPMLRYQLMQMKGTNQYSIIKTRYSVQTPKKGTKLIILNIQSEEGHKLDNES